MNDPFYFDTEKERELIQIIYVMCNKVVNNYFTKHFKHITQEIDRAVMNNLYFPLQNLPKYDSVLTIFDEFIIQGFKTFSCLSYLGKTRYVYHLQENAIENQKELDKMYNEFKKHVEKIYKYLLKKAAKEEKQKIKTKSKDIEKYGYIFVVKLFKENILEPFEKHELGMGICTSEYIRQVPIIYKRF